MAKRIIKDSNDLLGFLIQIKDESNNCNLLLVLDEIGTDRELDLVMMLNELADRKILIQLDCETVRLYESGIASYISPMKANWNKVKVPISYIFTYIMGIVSAVVSQLILNLIVKE